MKRLADFVLTLTIAMMVAVPLLALNATARQTLGKDADGWRFALSQEVAPPAGTIRLQPLFPLLPCCFPRDAANPPGNDGGTTRELRRANDRLMPRDPRLHLLLHCLRC